jgi:hypothetical protein
VARVESVELALVSVRPPRLRVDVRGSLPDACTELEPIDPQRLGPRIEITLATRRPFAAACPPAETPFQRSIPLSLSDAIRSYVVEVNGVSRTLLLPPDSEADSFDHPRSERF